MNKIQLIDAETLYYKPLAHPRMLIDGILADGLAVMAGDSKIGKSWMGLWLCLQISKGEPVWGIPTRKTDVVYLALEDREWRIQQRMQELTEAPPENLHFGFSCGQLGSELESQIEAVLQDYPSTGLIFIDTLQMIRDNVSGKVNAYAQDYAKLELPASPWEVWDAMEKVRLQTDDILYMEVEDYSQELEEQYLAGNLLADLALKDSRPFRKELERIIAEVF